MGGGGRTITSRPFALHRQCDEAGDACPLPPRPCSLPSTSDRRLPGARCRPQPRVTCRLSSRAPSERGPVGGGGGGGGGDNQKPGGKRGGGGEQTLSRERACAPAAGPQHSCARGPKRPRPPAPPPNPCHHQPPSGRGIAAPRLFPPQRHMAHPLIRSWLGCPLSPWAPLAPAAPPPPACPLRQSWSAGCP